MSHAADPFDIDNPMGTGLPFKLGRSGVMIELAFANCGENQSLRELLSNSLGAAVPGQITKVQITPDWTHVQNCVKRKAKRVYRLSVWDDGCGMSPKTMTNLLSTLYESSKVQGVTGNFGIGARVALLPANPYGVIYMSWQNGKGYMVRLYRNAAGEYVMHQWQDEHGNPYSIKETPVEYNKHWDGTPRVHGTLVICLGDGPECQTYLGFPTDKKKRSNRGGLSYLNTRYWSFPPNVKAEVWDPGGFKGRPGQEVEEMWPDCYGRSIDRGTKRAFDAKDEDSTDSHGSQWRTLMGMVYYLKSNYCDAHGTVNLSSAKVHWFIYSDSRNASGGLRCNNANAYGPTPGGVGVMWQNEVYEYDKQDNKFKKFGIISNATSRRMALVIEPDTSMLEVRTDQSRSRLTLMGAAPLPWMEWAVEWAQKMPDEVRKHIEVTLPRPDNIEDIQAKFNEAMDLISKELGFGGGAGRGTTPGQGGGGSNPGANPGSNLPNGSTATAGTGGTTGTTGATGEGSSGGGGGGGGSSGPKPGANGPNTANPAGTNGTGGGGSRGAVAPRGAIRPKVPEIAMLYDENPKYIGEIENVAGKVTLALYVKHPYITDLVKQFLVEYPQIGAEGLVVQNITFECCRKIGTQYLYAQLFRTGNYPGDWTAEDYGNLLSPEAITFSLLDKWDLVCRLRQTLGGVMGKPLPTPDSESSVAAK